MSTPPPDWAALYQKHRDAMYRAAARVLRAASREAEADDAVMLAMESLMKSPPSGVESWEAVMITAAKRRALDIVKSAWSKHSSGSVDLDSISELAGADFTDELDDEIDRQRAGALAWDALATLDLRHRQVAWEYVAKGRPRAEVAAELGVSPSRVSQLAKESLDQLRETLKEGGEFE